MPNWCNNTMTISHPDPAMMEKAAEAWNTGEFLQTLIPCPLELRETPSMCGKNTPEQARNLKKYGYRDWYDWCLANWGTKWDIGRRDEQENDAVLEGNCFTVSFDSAWSPPTGAYERLTEMGFGIQAYYYEPGMDFCGRFVEGIDETFRLKDAPRNIDEMFGITETREAYDELSNRG